MAMTQINFRIDEDIKNNAEKACKELGMSLSTAINIYLKRLGDDYKLPLEICGRELKENINLKKDILFLYPLVENETISTGKLAEILNISKRELVDILGELDIPYIRYDISDVEDDVKTLKELFG